MANITCQPLIPLAMHKYKVRIASLPQTTQDRHFANPDYGMGHADNQYRRSCATPVASLKTFGKFLSPTNLAGH